jgi:hypothetical protein
MGLVRLPVGRLRGHVSERSALKQGIAVALRARALHVVAKSAVDGPIFCACCAAPIEFGPVVRGLDSYCSVECSLGGDHPA